MNTSTKYHQVRANSKNAGKWVACQAKTLCPNGGRHIDRVELKVMSENAKKVQQAVGLQRGITEEGYYLTADGKQIKVQVTRSEKENGNWREQVTIPAGTLIPPVNSDINDNARASVTNAFNQMNLEPEGANFRLVDDFVTTPTLAGQLVLGLKITFNGREGLKLKQTNSSLTETYGPSRMAEGSNTYAHKTLKDFKEAMNADPTSPFTVLTDDSTLLDKKMSFNAAAILKLSCKLCKTSFTVSPYYANKGRLGCPNCLPPKSSIEEQRILLALKSKSSLTISSGPTAKITNMTPYGSWKSSYADPDFVIDNKTVAEYDGWHEHNSLVGATRDADKSHVLLGKGYNVIRVRFASGKHKPQMLNLVHPKYREFDGSGMTPTEIADKISSLHKELTTP